MSIEALILDRLLVHLQDVNMEDPSIRISLPNVPFEPANGETYLEARFLPNTTQSPFLSLNDPNEYKGILQVTVCVPSATGEIYPRELTGNIIRHFQRGLKLWCSSMKILIDRQPSTAPALQDADRIRIPISISYITFA